MVSISFYESILTYLYIFETSRFQDYGTPGLQDFKASGRQDDPVRFQILATTVLRLHLALCTRLAPFEQARFLDLSFGSFRLGLFPDQFDWSHAPLSPMVSLRPLFGVGHIRAQREGLTFVTRSHWPAHLGPAELGQTYVSQPCWPAPFRERRRLHRHHQREKDEFCHQEARALPANPNPSSINPKRHRYA